MTMLSIYLTGHGEILDDGDFVVLTRDTRPSDLLNRTVPAGEIVKMTLAGTRVRRLLLLLDTCYSGRGGEDMTREALRRIDDPGRRADDQGETAEGGGVVVVAATRPYQQALPGAFTSCLDRAARSLAAAGNAPRTLRVGALIGAVKSDQRRPKSQTSVWHQVGMTGDEPSFIVNPRYRPPLIDADLLEQERARYAEQAADHLRDRFLPATRWFTGRHAALTSLGRWLGSPAAPGAAVVTGHAGSGKTALLGLLAALSDPDQAPGVPRGGLPPGLTIPDDAITETIYAGTMTTGQVRDRIAAAAGLRADTTAELIEGLGGRGAGALTVLIDALDEAADPPGLASGLLGPLIRERPGGLRLLLGTRPHLLTARLLGKPETGRYLLVDLDSAGYADPVSIRAYIRRILLSEDPLDSAYRSSGVYRTAPAALLGRRHRRDQRGGRGIVPGGPDHRGHRGDRDQAAQPRRSRLAAGPAPPCRAGDAARPGPAPGPGRGQSRRAAASPGLRPGRRVAVGGHLAPPGRRAVPRPRVRQPRT